MKLADLQAAAAQKPPKTLQLAPDFWPATWEGRPRSDVVIGLRSLSELDARSAAAQAEKEARDLYPEPGDSQSTAYNDALRRVCVARALCDPNDQSKPHRLFTLSEDQVELCWTVQGVRYVFEELERLILESGPLHPVATDEDVAELAGILLAGDALPALDPPRQRRARRLLAFVLDELRGDPD